MHLFTQQYMQTENLAQENQIKIETRGPRALTLKQSSELHVFHTCFSKNRCQPPGRSDPFQV